ncbi:D-galactonate dehydratase [Aspergillus affinis]|uniref:D-galactonate dehydratase n=1 Tax=Aspergillus affinis TaxID=1070780 RepID=UPI0022FE6C89|nr:D-galactonate dehydratase [Aspergillus affinis]KAI9046350.1 D-galactonate dehydratase [Aspergillus affinis]
MAKIKSIEYFRVKPRWLFVKVTDDEGGFGWGEGTLEGHTQAVEGALDEIIVRLVGLEADDIEHIWQLVWRLGFYRGGPVFMSAISGIDIALWDLKGRTLGVPVYQLLGGKVRNKVQVYAWIGGDRPSDVEVAAKARIEQGLKCIKMNATEDVNWLDGPAVLDSCVERLKTVKSLGLDAGLDFHGRLHKPMAKQLAKALEPYRPLFIEEPLLCEHPEALKQLSGLTTIPIAFGERLFTRWDVKRFLEDGSVDVLQPDIAHAGGISETRRIASLAETYDVAIAPHCPLGPIALAASIQVAVSTPNFVIQEMSLGMHYNVEAGDIDLNSYLVDKSVFDIAEGFVKAPSGVGLGIEIDEELVRAISKETEPWAPKEFYGPDGAIRRTALVTGGTRGIGQQMAIGMAEAGADIVLVQRDTSNQETKQRIEALGRTATIYTADLSSRPSISALVSSVLKDGHDISILLNCAGIQRRHPSHLFPDSDWDEVLQVNLSTVFTLCRDIGAYMLTRAPDASGKRGNIINIGSLVSFQGGLTVPAYAAAKGGIAQLTKALSNEWAAKGVNVNAIAPGYVATDMTSALMQDEERSAGILARIPAGRWGTPEDFKGVTVFLASRASGYVTGEVLTVDGGWMGR